MSDRYHNPRIDHPANRLKPACGEVRLDPIKCLWLAGMSIGTVIAVMFYFSWAALVLFVLFTGFILLLGHSLGMHRLFIHRAYKTPRWLEVLLVHFGALVGIAGPMGMLITHDTRDWAQRQARCHAFFSHDKPWWHDAYWQLLCSIKLKEDLEFRIEDEIADDKIINFIERYWMWQQLPWAIAFYLLDGWGLVLWGVCARVLVSNLGHWFIGHIAHNHGHRSWQVKDAVVQGFDVRWVSLLTMGEGWHNNHHAFPYSAKFGLFKGQLDPGWWTLCGLAKIGLVTDLVTPDLHQLRDDLERVKI